MEDRIQRKSSIFKIVSNIVDIIVFPVIILSLCVSCFMLLSKSEKAITPVFGFAFVRVLSNSMSRYCDEANRSFYKGDICILSTKTTYEVGDVIAFYNYKDSVDNSYDKFDITTTIETTLPVKDKDGNIIYNEDGTVQTYSNNYYPQKDDNGNVVFDQTLFSAVKNAKDGEIIAGTDKYKKSSPSNRTSVEQVSKKADVYFHQIVQIKIDTTGKIFYVTKGSANGSTDGEIREDFVVGKYVTSSKWLSDFIGFCSSSLGLIVLVIVPTSLIIMFESLSILEQISNIVLEKKVIARAIAYDTKECKKAKICDEMPYYNKMYLYDVMPKKYKPDLYEQLWGIYRDSHKKKQRKVFEVSKHAIENYNVKDTQEYYDIWLEYYTSNFKQKKIIAAQKKAKKDRFSDVLMLEYQNFRPKKHNKDNKKKIQLTKEEQEKKLIEIMSRIENIDENASVSNPNSKNEIKKIPIKKEKLTKNKKNNIKKPPKKSLKNNKNNVQ